LFFVDISPYDFHKLPQPRQMLWTSIGPARTCCCLF